MIKESKGLGVGLGQFKFRYLPVYSKLSDGIKKRAYAQNFPLQNVTEAHNEYLQFFAELGFPGLFFFLWLCSYALLCGSKYFSRLSEERDILLNAAAAASFFSFCVTSFFSFPFHLPHTLCMACLVCVLLTKKPADEEIPSYMNERALAAKQVLWGALTLAVVFFSAKMYIGSVHLRQARTAFAYRHPASAGKHFKSALAFAPDDGETLFYYGMFLFNTGKLKEAHEAFEKAKKTTSNLNINMATAKSALATGHLKEAETEYRYVLALYPWKEYQCASYYDLGEIYALQKHYSDARGAMIYALEFCEDAFMKKEIARKMKALNGK